MSNLECCRLCPRNCMVNRVDGEVGYCRAGDRLVVARAALHYWEEPCISLERGSGTIFFSYCNLRCVFCQNYDISTLHKGKEISVSRFVEICLELQEKGAVNINLVTPTHYVPLIVSGLRMAKKRGLVIPIIYNTNAYENLETISLLEGLVDVYLPDLKYYDDDLAERYSKASNYFEVASRAIDFMYRQVGKPVFNEEGAMVKGVIVRHLVLPSREDDSKKILSYLYDKYGDNIYISIMNQYTPLRKFEYVELNSKVDSDVYDEVVNYAYDLGIRNAFVQEDDTQLESFVPDFESYEGV